ncbi:AbrB/MazE/SpoVT family DNA-binding domain-containing protein [Candidatus Microgenomates bacterium]|nr:AbrB/MazE/SpoVT family DNA-binding domain-containing protein [Candidatus Microgenomates bacterium]
MIQTVTAFQLGTSTVVTLPKKLGIKPGQSLKIRKSRGEIVIKPKKKMTKEEIYKFVKSLSGGLNLKYHPTPDEINKALDEQYEEMLPRR